MTVVTLTLTVTVCAGSRSSPPPVPGESLDRRTPRTSACSPSIRRRRAVVSGDAAHAAGHERCVLHALEDNAPALRLYRSAGFRPVGEPFPHALSGRPTRTHVV
jgi:hypothetical protein